MKTITDAHRSQNERPKFRSDYIFVEKINGWLKLHRVPTDWVDARERCQFEGMHMDNCKIKNTSSLFHNHTPLRTMLNYISTHASLFVFPRCRSCVSIGRFNAAGHEIDHGTDYLCPVWRLHWHPRLVLRWRLYLY